MKLRFHRENRNNVELQFSWHAIDKCYGRIGKSHIELEKDLRNQLHNIEKCVNHEDCYRVKGAFAIYILAKDLTVITVLTKDKDKNHFRKHFYQPLGKYKSQLLWSAVARKRHEVVMSSHPFAKLPELIIKSFLSPNPPKE